IKNHAKEPVDLEVKLDVASDFADLFEVKDKLEKVGQLYRKVEGEKLTLGYQRETFVRETVISANKKGDITEDGFMFKVKLPSQSAWSVSFEVSARGRRADLEDEELPKSHSNGH